MERELTERGFPLYTFKDSRGKPCSLQESSLATEHRIWLGHNEIGLSAFTPGKGWEEVNLSEKGWVNCIANTRVELSREKVKDLLPVLQKFAETGEI